MCFTAAAFLFHYAMVRPKKRRRKKSVPSLYADGGGENAMRAFIDQKRKWLLTMPVEEVSIRSKDGLLLKGIFWPAEKKTGKTILCIHGYHNEGVREFGVYAGFYHEKGYNLLIPDDRAHGKSEGSLISFGYYEKYDCLCWCEYASQRVGAGCEVLLHGISMGAATVLLTSGEALPSFVKGIIADCGYTSASDEFTHELKHVFHLPVFPILYLASGICRIRQGFTFSACAPVNAVKKADTPILFIHGDQDTFVPTWMAQKLYDCCASKKELLIVKGAKHAKSYLVNAKLWESTVSRFLEEIGFSSPL